MAIRVAVLAEKDKSKIVTLPVTGLFISNSKSSKCPVLYIQHRTHTGANAPTSYKKMPVVTIDGSEKSLFYRLCVAAGFRCLGMTHRDAADKLAQCLASTGGVQCRRVGKVQDWQDIKLVDWDTKLEPWRLPMKGEMKIESLLKTKVATNIYAEE